MFCSCCLNIGIIALSLLGDVFRVIMRGLIGNWRLVETSIKSRRYGINGGGIVIGFRSWRRRSRDRFRKNRMHIHYFRFFASLRAFEDLG